MHRRIAGLRPVDPPGPDAAGAPWQQQPVPAQRQQHLPGRSQLGEPAETVAIASATASSGVMTTVPAGS